MTSQTLWNLYGLLLNIILLIAVVKLYKRVFEVFQIWVGTRNGTTSPKALDKKYKEIWKEWGIQVDAKKK